MLELLDLVVAGTLTAQSVREAIAERAAALDAKYDPCHGNEAAQLYARCFGDCDTCWAAEPGFRRTLAEEQERVAKAQDPDTYPYVIMGRTAHLRDALTHHPIVHVHSSCPSTSSGTV
ncbi:hypothetical protein [Streptomyces lichenis]|uniref:Uncharacterized protein n=1 Tax=Streptomyces lichenis TaxID=2306967 RepID=A0ABT0IAT6_9ACTN|nr:hypothetical protein [Streptomyces lichenis]MCK8678415.1 hypothetical protein [Streptomyces lichenis]